MHGDAGTPRISEFVAIQIARDHAHANAWPWHGESVHSRFDSAGIWHITTRPDTEWIANVHILVDDVTHTVVGGTCRPDVIDPISRRRALEIARDCVLRNGWSWREVEICKEEFDCADGRRINCWAISTNRDRMGGNATIILDAETGDVVETMYATR